MKQKQITVIIIQYPKSKPKKFGENKGAVCRIQTKHTITSALPVQTKHKNNNLVFSHEVSRSFVSLFVYFADISSLPFLMVDEMKMNIRYG